MEYYVCPRCKYTTKNKWNMKTHLERENTCKVKEDGVDISVSVILSNMYPKKAIECAFCDKTYKSIKGYEGHIFRVHYDKKRRVLENALEKVKNVKN